MRKGQETIEINKLYERFANAKTDREKLDIFTAVYKLTNRFNYVVSSDKADVVDKMQYEYFFPVDEKGNLDEKKQEERFTAYNEWLLENLVLLGNKIDEYKVKIDTEYAPTTDEKGRDNNLELAKKYASVSAEGMIIADDGELKGSIFINNEDKINQAFGDVERKFGEGLRDNYLKLFNNLSPEKKRLCELAKESTHTSPFIVKNFDKKVEDIEYVKYHNMVASDPVVKDFIGDRKFDVNDMKQLTSWHKVRNNNALESIMTDIKGNKRDSHKNSDLYQNIIDAYDKACDAPTAIQFAHEMKQLRVACKKYIAHRNPTYQDGKIRLDLIKKLNQHIEKSLMPVIDDNIDAFELVDKDTILKEMQEEELNVADKAKEVEVNANEVMHQEAKEKMVVNNLIEQENKENNEAKKEEPAREVVNINQIKEYDGGDIIKKEHCKCREVEEFKALQKSVKDTLKDISDDFDNQYTFAKRQGYFAAFVSLKDLDKRLNKVSDKNYSQIVFDEMDKLFKDISAGNNTVSLANSIPFQKIIQNNPFDSMDENLKPLEELYNDYSVEVSKEMSKVENKNKNEKKEMQK